MNETANPILMTFLLVLRCLIPLAILFGISYLLRRMELIIEPPAPVKREPEGGADSASGEPVKTDAPAKKSPTAKIPSSKKKTASGKKRASSKRKKKEA